MILISKQSTSPTQWKNEVDELYDHIVELLESHELSYGQVATIISRLDIWRQEVKHELRDAIVTKGLIG